MMGIKLEDLSPSQRRMLIGQSAFKRCEVDVLKAAKKPSKYRNVKTVVGGGTFDSRKEADYWVGLQARERAGEIVDLRHHVTMPLLAPNRVHGHDVIVSAYEADFVYTDMQGSRHVVDAKGVRTRLYLLKRKWLELQDGIVIEEV